MSNQSKARSGGVLPINAAATKKTGITQKQAQRSPAPKLRLIIRRLAPGLTESEFWDFLGAEWRAGAGKVDWAAYKSGKISKDPAKPSKPARAYLKVKDQSLLEELSAKIKQTTFQDVKNTTRDPCLIGPPSLEFAPYSKTPGGRARNDGRQGTIDQDQEFIDFLQSLTEPLTKAPNDTDADSKQEKVTMTPLVQYIKEKKANKAKEKEAAAAKASKKGQDSKPSKPSAKGDSNPTVVVKSTTAVSEKARVAKATQDTVKAINRSVASMQSKNTPAKSDTKPLSKEKDTTPTPQSTPKRERTRGDASAAARMVARDLGLAPKEPKSSRGSRAPSSVTEVASTTQAEKPTPAQPKAVNTDSSSKAPVPPPTAPSNNPPSGPRNARTTNNPPAKSATSTAVQRPAKATPQPSAEARSAFLKHANPSQGVTEELLRSTFSIYGAITRCEIDKKKGLGYVDFAEAESLRKAMAASPVKVGNGQVVVLENRSPYNKRQQHNNPPTTGGVATSRPTVTSATKAQPTASATTSAVNSPKPETVQSVAPAVTPASPAVVNTGSLVTVTATKDVTGNALTTTKTGDNSGAAPSAPRGGGGGGGGGGGAGGGRGNNGAGRGARGQNIGRGSIGRNFRSRGGQQARGGRGAANNTTADPTTLPSTATPPPPPPTPAAITTQPT